MNDKTIFVAYRGTDDTIVGWKENFNMSFMHPVPAQTEALSYLESVAAERSESIYAGGHSKGGNLAVYALSKAPDEIKERVACAFNNDGPGFNREFISSEDYAQTRDRIRTLVPQSSVVGMLLEHEESYEVVESTQTGLLQHNGFSWRVSGGRFIHLDTVTKESRRIDRTLKRWLSEMSVEKRRRMVDSLFDILVSNNAKTLTDLSSEKLRLIKAWNNLDSESKVFLKRCIRLIVKDSKAK